MKLSFTVATPDVQDTGILALRGDPEYNLPMLAEYGYNGVELMVRDVSRLDTGALRNLCRDHGLDVCAVSSGQLAFEEQLFISSPDQRVRAETVRRIKEIIDFTQALNCPVVNVGTIRGDLPAQSKIRQESILNATECMKEILDHAEKRAVIIAVEPQCRYVVNWHNTLNDTFEWIQVLGHPCFRLLLDIYHTMIEEASITASLIRYFDHIAHIQFSDSNRLAPGSGQMDYPGLIRVLMALKYQGYLSVEVVQKPSGLEAARRSAEYLIPLINENQ